MAKKISAKVRHPNTVSVRFPSFKLDEHLISLRRLFKDDSLHFLSVANWKLHDVLFCILQAGLV